MARPGRYDAIKQQLDRWAVWLVESEHCVEGLSLPSNTVLGRYIEMNHTRTERHDLTKVYRKNGKVIGRNAIWCKMKQDFKVTPITPTGSGISLKRMDRDSTNINKAFYGLSIEDQYLIILRHIKKKETEEIMQILLKKSIDNISDDLCTEKYQEALSKVLKRKPDVSKRFIKIYARLTSELKKGETTNIKKLASA